MRGIFLGFRGISLRIPRNVIIFIFRRILLKIPGKTQEGCGKKIVYVQKDSGNDCSIRFRGMFKKVPRNVSKDFGEC